MILTDENYYSVEADKEYMSCSQLQGFLECEAKQMAKLQGRWTDKPSEAFLVGNFFHSYFESPEAHAKFCEENAEHIYSKASYKKYLSMLTMQEIAGDVTRPDNILELLSPYKTALNMIDTLESDPIMKQFIDMPGENERIIEGEIWGMKWRGKLDKYIPDNRFIIDYKTVANIWETSYNPITKSRETFVEKYGYIFRAAVYSLLEMQEHFKIDFQEAYKLLKNDEYDIADFILLCVSKQEYPDKEALRLNHVQAYIREIERLKDIIPIIREVRAGRMQPKRCGMCDYCRSTKQLSEIKPYYELIPELRTAKEFEDIKLGDENAV